MRKLRFTRSGAGAPLVLLHGIGSSRRAWDPVIATLAERFDVIAVDLPGFGESPPVHDGLEPVPAVLAQAVAGLLDGLGVRSPHVVGNSLGGWVALELAAIRPPASVTLLSPAGLWRGTTPLYCLASLRASRWLSRYAPGLLSWLVGYRPGRVVVLGQTHGRPGRMTPARARATLRAMGTCPGFDATLTATARRRYVSGRPITAPVTVAFGAKDRLLLRRQSRHLDELPAGAHVAALPGCGHVPMADDPHAVAALITASASRAQPTGAPLLAASMPGSSVRARTA